MIRVGLLGSRGRMGRRVSELLRGEFSTRAQLTAETDLGDSFAPLLSCDVVIDFSTVNAMKECAEFFLASENKLPALAVGSTGWSSNEKNIISKLAQRTSVLQTSNFSLGVATLNRILRDAAPLLRKLGYTPVLVEAHHCHKKDAPSGTALLLRDTIAAADGAEPCQTHSIRAGEVIGDHEVTYYGAADHLCFGHFAQDRGLFARGSIEVALWLAKMARAQSGQLSMDDFVKEMLK